MRVLRKAVIAVLLGILVNCPFIAFAAPEMTATFDLTETKPFNLSLDSSSLFDIEDVEFNKPYDSTLAFRNKTKKKLTLSLIDVESVIESKVLYDRSHLKISDDGGNVLFDGEMNDSRFSQEVASGKSVTYTFSYSIPMDHVPDNSLMGAQMHARFTFMSGVDIETEANQQTDKPVTPETRAPETQPQETTPESKMPVTTPESAQPETITSETTSETTASKTRAESRSPQGDDGEMSSDGNNQAGVQTGDEGPSVYIVLMAISALICAACGRIRKMKQ